MSRAKSSLEKVRELEAKWSDRVALRTSLAEGQRWRCWSCDRQMLHHGRFPHSAALVRLLPGEFGGDWNRENCVVCCNQCATRPRWPGYIDPKRIEAISLMWGLSEADTIERLEDLYRERVANDARKAA